MASTGKYNKPFIPDPVYPKEKSEDYNLMGGINSKVSLYTNGPAEFRDLSNLNFVNLGALTKRPGTTLFGGATFSTPITSTYEFQKLSGQSYLIALSTNRMNIMYATGSTTAIDRGGSLLAVGQNNFSFSTFVDRLFACSSDYFYRLNPTVSTGSLYGALYSLPDGTSMSAIGLTGLPGNATTGLSGTFVFSFCYLNDRGYIGPPAQFVTLSPGSTQAVKFSFGYGASFLQAYYGVTAAIVYMSQIDGVVPAQIPIGVGAFNLGPGNTTIGYLTNNAALPTNTAPVAPNTFYLPGSSGSFIFGGGLGVQPTPPFIPRFLEVFNNQMFMAGFSTAPSTFWWSEIGEPEGVEPQFSAQVRTNDGDIISGMRSYLGSLLITKRKSLHVLSGTNPSNFVLQELSDQYGCLSHRAIVPWNNVVWFLDSKGIVEYNGANLRCVSTPVESLFANMNLTAAYDNACGIHVKRFNEIWFAIPTGALPINNQIIVYDYVANAWTHYDGLLVQTLTNAFGGFSQSRPFSGNSNGGLVYFDPALTQDQGQPMICTFDSIFFAARGQTTENMYRRFYLNVDPVLGFTQAISMFFQTNFGSTVQLSRTMYQAPYQSRVDFGLSARSIQASMNHISASLPLKINGFAFESRFQRGV